MIKVRLYVTIGILALVLLTSTWGATANSSAATCSLTKITITAGKMTANTLTIWITPTPLCWSGYVEVNRGNADVHVITLLVSHGVGTGIVPRLENSSPCYIYCVHPYAINPGLRGNNLVVPAN